MILASGVLSTALRLSASAVVRRGSSLPQKSRTLLHSWRGAMSHVLSLVQTMPNVLIIDMIIYLGGQYCITRRDRIMSDNLDREYSGADRAECSVLKSPKISKAK